MLPLPGYGELMPPARPGARERVRAELGLAEDDVLVLAFGVLRPEKQLELLIDAVGRLDAPRLRVLVAGDSRSERAVEPAAGRRRAADPALVRGRVDRRPGAADLFAAADVCVLARSVEWTSASTVLALSLGVPVVAADLRSTRRAARPWRVVLRPGDAASLAARLAEAAAAGAGARAARGEAGRRACRRAGTSTTLAAATALELRGTRPAGVPVRAAAAAAVG